MSKSHALTKLSIFIGSFGVFAFILAWIAEFKGFVLYFEARHWYNDAMILLLVAIWLKLGAIYHKDDKPSALAE
jgi:hypothetical protein